MDYKLTKRDKAFLLKVGYLEEDLSWVEQTANECGYLFVGKRRQDRITRERAIHLLGKQRWLTGIGRACFHRTAARPTKYANAHGDPYVYFDNIKN